MTPQASDAMPLDSRVNQMEAEMAQVRKLGIIGLLKLKFTAWLEERMKEAAIRKLQAQQAVMEEQRKTAVAESALREVIQTGEAKVEKGRIAYREALWQRLHADMAFAGISVGPASIGGTTAPGNAGAGASSTVTDEQVETLALRVFMNLAQNGNSDADWQAYQEEIYKHLPRTVAQEVVSRVEGMRRAGR
jgi:hypothetical protein